MVNIPRSRHGEPACVAAKQKELRDYENFEVFDVVDNDEATDNIIATEWVLIEKKEARWNQGNQGQAVPQR